MNLNSEIKLTLFYNLKEMESLECSEFEMSGMSDGFLDGIDFILSSRTLEPKLFQYAEYYEYYAKGLEMGFKVAQKHVQTTPVQFWRN